MFDSKVLGYPLESVADIRADEYNAQAVPNVYTTLRRSEGHAVKLHMDQWEGQKWNRSPGNLYSWPARVKMDPSAGETVRISLGSDDPGGGPAQRHTLREAREDPERSGQPVLGPGHVRGKGVNARPREEVPRHRRALGADPDGRFDRRLAIARGPGLLSGTVQRSLGLLPRPGRLPVFPADRHLRGRECLLPEERVEEDADRRPRSCSRDSCGRRRIPTSREPWSTAGAHHIAGPAFRPGRTCTSTTYRQRPTTSRARHRRERTSRTGGIDRNGRQAP